MNERKKIDSLFQEKFKDFEVNPSEEIWVAIEEKLENKKRRRIIPFWWKLSGVAAVFLIGFLTSKSIYDSHNKTENSIVNERNSNKTEKPNSIDAPKKDLKNNVTIQSENNIVNQTNVNKTKQKKVEESDKYNNSSTGTIIATNPSNEMGNSIVYEENKQTSKTIYSSKSAITERKSSHHRKLKNKLITEKDKLNSTESELEKTQNQVAQNIKNNPKATTEKEIAQNESKDKISPQIQNTLGQKNINLDDLKGNDISKIAIKEIDKKVNDTASKKSVANNELEELLNEKESKLKQESKRNRWQLTSNVAPVFLGSFSNGSPIDSTLSKNSKSYNTNVGFGLGISYAVNKKLSVRTGLNKVNMSYDTNNISFFTGIQAKTLKNVSPTASSAMIHIESNDATTNGIPSEDGFLPFEITLAQKNTGYLKQEIGYLEMPVEMTYNLLDKKFGIKIIGGFSTLFLQDNSIMIISEGRDTLLGEANNLNDIHFSTNLGVGVKYSFLKSFEFNIEPTLKYQLNTFTANAGNFKPYLFGVYSGISYKF